jgi:glycosyltransferase involved in cell wall biosynthesis
MADSKSPPPISIVIPCYNSEKTIQATLDSVLAQDLKSPYQVIVADSSTDNTPDLIRHAFPEVRLLHRPKQMQSGTARNLGVSVAQGEILAFTDSDCIVPPDWLHRLVAHHHHLPQYAAVGGSITNGNPQYNVSWAGYLAEFNIHLPVGKSPYDTRHIPTSNISYKRWVFERYGGFPGDDVIKHVDLLFNYKLHSHGERILCDPTLPVAHIHRTRLRAYLHHQWHIGQGTVQAMRRLPCIQGSWLARHPYPGTLLLPGVTLIKFLRNSSRFVSWSPATMYKHPLLLPLFALGLLWWSSGFGTELLKGQRRQISSARK